MHPHFVIFLSNLVKKNFFNVGSLHKLGMVSGILTEKPTYYRKHCNQWKLDTWKKIMPLSKDNAYISETEK